MNVPTLKIFQYYCYRIIFEIEWAHPTQKHCASAAEVWQMKGGKYPSSSLSFVTQLSLFFITLNHSYGTEMSCVWKNDGAARAITRFADTLNKFVSHFYLYHYYIDRLNSEQNYYCPRFAIKIKTNWSNIMRYEDQSQKATLSSGIYV